MAGANYYLADNPAQFTIHMELVRGNIGLVYDSVVEAKGPEADWNGEAWLYTMGACFSQNCRTLCDDTGSVKAWRGNWCSSKNSSPALLISSWLRQVEQGIGYYSQNTRTPQDDTQSFSDMTAGCYTVKLEDQKIDWSGLCDVYVDSLFGGEELLGAFQRGTVTLYFTESDCFLIAILISAMEETSWVELAIQLQKAESEPAIDLSDLIIREGILSEEWNMEPTE